LEFIDLPSSKTGTDLFSHRFILAGGAGPRRFSLPITVGRLQVSEDGVVGEIIDLPV